MFSLPPEREKKKLKNDHRAVSLLMTNAQCGKNNNFKRSCWVNKKGLKWTMRLPVQRLTCACGLPKHMKDPSSPLPVSDACALSLRQEGQDGGMWWRSGGVEASVGSWSKPEGSVRGEVVNRAKQSDWLCYTMQGTVTGLRCLFRSGNLRGSSVVAWPCTQTQRQKKHSFVSQLWTFKIWEFYQSGVFFFC